MGCVNHKGQVYPGEHQGIIRKSIFDQAQETLSGNRRNGPGRFKNKYGHLLKGILRCGACGTAYIPTVTKKGNRTYRYYTCSGAQKNGADTCPHANISAPQLEKAIVEQIRVIGADPEVQAETLRHVKRAAREQRNTLDAETKRLRQSNEKAEAEKTGLLKALAGGEVDGPIISKRLGELEGKTATLTTRLAEIERERVAANASTHDPNDLASALGMFDPIWDVLFPAEQARIIELLIRQIVYNGKSGNLSILFHPTGIKALAGEITQEATA